MKTCSKCKELKTTDSFGNKKASKDGKEYRCKQCKSLMAKEEYKKNKSTYKKYAKDNSGKIASWMKENRYRYKGKYKETEKRCRDRNKDAKKINAREYYLNNKSELRKKQKIYYLENKEKIHIQKRKWEIKNRDHVNKKAREYNSSRLKTDINFKMSKRLRSRMLRAINGAEARKGLSSIELIGCSVDELKEYLQSLFTKGMTWDDYGKHGWHIDHIIPCAVFNLTKTEEQEACFHYSNLQPLWATDNLKKGSKIL